MRWGWRKTVLRGALLRHRVWVFLYSPFSFREVMVKITTMRNKIVSALAIALFVSPVAWAQVETAVFNEKVDVLKQRLERVKAFYDRLPEQKQRALSSGAQNMVQLAVRWDEVEAALRSAPRDFSALKEAFESQRRR